MLRALLAVARAAFLAAAVTFAVWGLRSQWPEIIAALQDVALWRWLVAGVSFTFGTAVTGVTWTAILGGYGHWPGAVQTLPTFFVGQLGKYIPGSVWSFAAQAQMASESGVPARTTVATSLLFLIVNLASAGVVGCVGALDGVILSPVPPPVVFVLALGSAALLTPVVLRAAAARLAADPWQPSRWRYSAFLAILMLVTWSTYGVAVWILLPSSPGVGTYLAAVSAFAIAYFLGVIVVIAPAGLGVREFTMTALLTPAVGVGAAGAAALLSRLLCTLVDFLLAAGTWFVRKWMPRRDGVAHGRRRHTLW